MNCALEIWNSVVDHCFMIDHDGDDLILEPTPFSKKLPDDLIQSIKTHKPELLQLLRYQEQADTLLLESSRRLAQAWPHGYDLDDDLRWQQTDKELHVAYHSGDYEKLRVILELRELLALKLFAAHRKSAAA